MDQEAIAERIIQDHTLYATVGGSIPFPFIDIAAVTAIQVDLVRALARVYEVPFDTATGKALIASIIGASAARLGASVVKALPGVGTISGGLAQAGLSGASTYAVGHLFRGHFSEQGTLADLDAEASLPVFRALLERGKEAARSLCLSSTRSIEDTTAILERLAKLKAEETISADEFERLKGETLANA